MASENSVVNVTTVISALLGLLGGAFTGGLTAYTQLKAAQEKYSIERAKMFEQLIVKLQDKKTSRMALLNLWQLYPEKRDQRIIVAAAIESGEPDLVDTIIGFETELAQLANVLQAKAASGDSSALQPLKRIDPQRAARVMVENIEANLRQNPDNYFKNRMINELKILSKNNQKVASAVSSVVNRAQKKPIYMEYLLYDVGADSSFAQNIESAYRSNSQIGLYNKFLGQGNFRPGDVSRIFESAKEYVGTHINDKDYNSFVLSNALIGLKNSSFRDALTEKSNQGFFKILREAVENIELADRVRKNALALLSRASARQALLAIAGALATDNVGEELTEQIDRQLDGRLIELVREEDPKVAQQPQCLDDDYKSCIRTSPEWAVWLKEIGSG